MRQHHYVAFFMLLCVSISHSFSQIYGYEIKGNEVIFSLNLKDCPKVSTDEGNFLDMKTITVESVNIAADWNNWEKMGEEYQMKSIKPNEFVLAKKVEDLGDGVQKFKFIINGKYWVEPPLKAKNCVPVVQGTSDYQNWLIALPQKEKNIASKEIYDIKLNIKNLPDGTYAILKMNNTLVESALAMDGKISWKGYVTAPTIASIYFPANGQSIPLVIEHKKYEITGVFQDNKIEKKEIKGSKLTSEYLSYLKSMDKFSVRITSSLEKYNQYLSEGDSMKAKAAMQKFNEIRQAQTLYDYQYIFKHSDAYFSLLNFSYCWQTYSLDSSRSLFQHFSPHLKETKLGEDMELLVKNAHKIKVGDEMMAFSIPDANGQLFSTETLKGKWILLDFWASWCGPCMGSMPTMRNIYNNYPNLSLVGIAAETEKEAWLSAIQREQMAWLQLSELKGESAVTLAMYNITFYPTYIIINPTGKISYISANIAEVESYLSTLGLSK